MPVTLVVRVRELDIGNAPRLFEELRRSLGQSGVFDVRVDLSALTFLDSTGVGLFVELRNFLLDNGGTLQLINAQVRVQQIFHMTGLSAVMGLPSGINQ